MIDKQWHDINMVLGLLKPKYWLWEWNINDYEARNVDE